MLPRIFKFDRFEAYCLTYKPIGLLYITVPAWIYNARYYPEKWKLFIIILWQDGNGTSERSISSGAACFPLFKICIPTRNERVRFVPGPI